MSNIRTSEDKALHLDEHHLCYVRAETARAGVALVMVESYSMPVACDIDSVAVHPVPALRHSRLYSQWLLSSFNFSPPSQALCLSKGGLMAAPQSFSMTEFRAHSVCIELHVTSNSTYLSQPAPGKVCVLCTKYR